MIAQMSSSYYSIDEGINRRLELLQQAQSQVLTEPEGTSVVPLLGLDLDLLGLSEEAERAEGKITVTAHAA